MAKRVALGSVLVALIGILVAGALIHTFGGNADVAEARGAGQGRWDSAEAGYESNESSWAPGASAQGKGRGGYGQSDSTFERQYPNYETAPENWNTYEGVVTQVPAAGVDLIVETTEGEELLIGTGPAYMDGEGFALESGESVRVLGYWDGEEFKASEITRLSDGQTITLRDESGQPAWSGGASRASGGDAVAATTGAQGRGRGRGAQGGGQGGYGGAGAGAELGALPASDGQLSDDEAKALMMALMDEYKAWSVYNEIVGEFGNVQPFASIQRAEENHIAALERLFGAYGLEVPANDWLGNVPTFDSLADACEAGVQAEIDNADLYDELFSMVDNPDIVRVFTALQRASEYQHLPAFERCAP